MYVLCLQIVTKLVKMNSLCTSLTCFNTSCQNILLYVLKIYMFIQQILSYSHLSNCTHNTLNIWNYIIIIVLHLLTQVFISIYRHLILFIAGQNSVGKKSIPGVKQSIKGIPVAVGITPLVSKNGNCTFNTMRVRICLSSEHGNQVWNVWTCRQNITRQDFYQLIRICETSKYLTFCEFTILGNDLLKL